MPNGVSDIAVIFTAVGVLLFGGGGVVAWVKQRRDSKNGVRQENRADVDSLNARAIAIVETQVEYLIKPLTEKVKGLETDVAILRTEVQNAKTKYWKAVNHIRNMYAWIAKNHSPDIAATVPPPPAELADDI